MAATPPRHAIILAQRDEDGTITLHDANGNKRVMETMGDYAKTVNAILDDTSLPDFQDVAPHEHNIEQAVIEAVRESFPPYMRPFLGPVAGSVRGWLKKVSAVRQTQGRPHPRGRARRANGRAA